LFGPAAPLLALAACLDRAEEYLALFSQSNTNPAMQRRMEARWSRYPTGQVEFRALKKMKTPPTWSRTQTHST
ncbi:hypothetical protein L914_08332, partial [Phytophthora nicotianae]